MDMDKIDAMIAAALGNKQPVYRPQMPSAPPSQTMPAPPPPAPVPGYAGGTSDVPAPWDMAKVDALIAASLGNKQPVYKPPLPSAPPTQSVQGYAGGTSNVPGPNSGSDSYDSYRRGLQQQDPNSTSNVVANMRAKLTGVDTQRPSPPVTPIPGYAAGTPDVQPQGLAAPFLNFMQHVGEVPNQLMDAARAGNWANYGVAPPTPAAPVAAPVAPPAPTGGSAPVAAKAAPPTVDPYANLRQMASGMTIDQFSRFMGPPPHPQSAADQMLGNLHQQGLNAYNQRIAAARDGTAAERNAAQSQASAALQSHLTNLAQFFKFSPVAIAEGRIIQNAAGGAGAVDPATATAYSAAAGAR